ncbi:MAG: hypothetical protein Q8N39_00195 [Pelolinea sp.]|nr:hypothetical protein [Pelolinea sp.]
MGSIPIVGSVATEQVGSVTRQSTTHLHACNWYFWAVTQVAKGD